jgi:hypothetical protein
VSVPELVAKVKSDQDHITTRNESKTCLLFIRREQSVLTSYSQVSGYSVASWFYIQFFHQKGAKARYSANIMHMKIDIFIYMI